MPRHHAGANLGGRPSLGRDMHQWNPRLELPLDERLRDQADTLGVSYSGYLLLVLAEAHAWHGPYLPEVQHPLPIALSVDELRTRTQELTTDECMRGASGPTTRRPVRADRELADEINARARALDVGYAQYIRAVLREAAGRTTPQRSVQESLLDLPRSRVRREEPLAS